MRKAKVLSGSTHVAEEGTDESITCIEFYSTLLITFYWIFCSYERANLNKYLCWRYKIWCEGCCLPCAANVYFLFSLLHPFAMFKLEKVVEEPINCIKSWSAPLSVSILNFFVFSVRMKAHWLSFSDFSVRMNALISVTINAIDMKFGRKIGEPHAQLMLIFNSMCYTPYTRNTNKCTNKPIWKP